MGQVLKIKFEDFKKLSDNRRIYYYDTPDYIDLHFLFDGFIIKTTVFREQIDNIERFFSDKLFYGAMRLDFKIPDSNNDNAELVITRESSPLFEVQDVQEEETKKTDIQRDGVDADSNN